MLPGGVRDSRRRLASPRNSRGNLQLQVAPGSQATFDLARDTDSEARFNLFLPIDAEESSFRLIFFGMDRVLQV